jgi:hypothetical protein
MNHAVGIWIDQANAVIVTATDEGVRTAKVASQVAQHPHFAGAQDGGGERKYEARHARQRDQFFDEIIDRIGHPDAILLFGPGEARLGLEQRIAHVKALARTAVEVEPADKLTTPQIVAAVRKHFGLRRDIPLLS